MNACNNTSTEVDFFNTTEADVIDFVVVPTVWSIFIIAGVFGNGLVVYVMLRHGERKATDCYVVNLALTDLAFISLVAPFTMMHYVQLTSWVLGDVLCKLHIYMVYVTLQATCLTLTAMTIDRYYAIVHPIRSIEGRTPGRAVMVSVGIWLVSFITDAPFVFFYGMVESCSGSFCRATWSPWTGKVMSVSVVMVTYVIPLSIIIVCYSLMIRQLYMKAGTTPHMSAGFTTLGLPAAQTRTRKLRKTSKMVAVVVLLFATFWLPIHVFQLWSTLDKNFPQTPAMYKFKIAAHSISYANSCLNPCVYSFIGDGFRKALRKAFPVLAARTSNAVGPSGRRAVACCTNQVAPQSRSVSPVPGPSTKSSDVINIGASTSQRKAFLEVKPAATGSEVRMQPEVVLRPRPECAVFSGLSSHSAMSLTPVGPNSRRAVACCTNQVEPQSRSVSPVPGPSTKSSDVINIGASTSQRKAFLEVKPAVTGSEVRMQPEVVLRPRPECAVFSGLSSLSTMSLSPVMKVEVRNRPC